MTQDEDTGLEAVNEGPLRPGFRVTCLWQRFNDNRGAKRKGLWDLLGIV